MYQIICAKVLPFNKHILTITLNFKKIKNLHLSAVFQVSIIFSPSLLLWFIVTRRPPEYIAVNIGLAFSKND